MRASCYYGDTALVAKNTAAACAAGYSTSSCMR